MVNREEKKELPGEGSDKTKACMQENVGFVQGKQEKVLEEAGWIMQAPEFPMGVAGIECQCWSQMDLSLNPTFF